MVYCGFSPTANMYTFPAVFILSTAMNCSPSSSWNNIRHTQNSQRWTVLKDERTDTLSTSVRNTIEVTSKVCFGFLTSFQIMELRHFLCTKMLNSFFLFLLGGTLRMPLQSKQRLQPISRYSWKISRMLVQWPMRKSFEKKWRKTAMK